MLRVGSVVRLLAGRATVCGLLGPAVLVLACSADDVPPVVWEGEHVDFATDEPIDGLCAGTLPQLDAVAGHLSRRLGSDTHVNYHWVPDRLHEFCPTQSVGCAPGDSVFSAYPTHQHELVHVLGGHRAHPVLEEGLAEKLGDDWEAFEPLAGDYREMWESADRGSIVGGYYPLAGYFVSYLIERFGLQPILELKHSSDPEDSVTVSDGKFEAVLGVGLEEILDDLAAEARPCEQTYYRDNSFECESPSISLVDEPEFAVDMSCAAPQVQGPRRGERWRTLTVEVEASASHEIGLTKQGGRGPGMMQMRVCGQTCTAYEDGAHSIDLTVDPDDPPASGFQLTDCIPAGRYVLRFSVDEDDEGEFLVRLKPGQLRDCAPG